MSQEPETQSLLPYPELTETAGRAKFREVAGRASKEEYFVPLSMIKVREGTESFNARRRPAGISASPSCSK